MLALILVAASVGLSNLAASIGIGVGGVGRGTRLRVVAIFGVLEAAMPILGLVIGRSLASSIGRETKWFAAALLIAVGVYGVVQAVRAGALANIRRRPGEPSESRQHLVRQGPAWQAAAPAQAGQPAEAHRSALVSAGPGRGDRPGLLGRDGGRESVKLLVTGVALSMDNLIAGFALGAYQVNIVAGALVFGAVSIAMSLAGLEFGARLGKHAGESGELIGGVVLIGVGIAIASGALG